MSTRTALVLALFLGFLGLAGCDGDNPQDNPHGDTAAAAASRSDDTPEAYSEGQRIFRFETFGDEEFWTDKARMHEVIQKSVSPATALKVGLKVDSGAIPADIAAAIQAGKVDLASPDTTVALLKLNAVVGLQGTVRNVEGKDTLVKVGITCALCHSTVDDSFAPGIGKRKDGWPNRDLNVGAIIALSPAMTPEQKTVYNSWGPGKYDPRYNLDGKSTPLVIPPAYGLAKVKNETYTAEGPISYWNAYVAVTQMHGLGNFSDPRLGIDVKHSPDQVTPLLPALRTYQHSLNAPTPPAASTDTAAARRGLVVFNESCLSCHAGTTGTDNNSGILHPAADTGMDPGYALRTANKSYRTTPLRGLLQHPPYFHDGSVKTLDGVVEHYNRVRTLKLTDAQKRDLVEFLKTL